MDKDTSNTLENQLHDIRSNPNLSANEVFARMLVLYSAIIAENDAKWIKMWEEAGEVIAAKEAEIDRLKVDLALADQIYHRTEAERVKAEAELAELKEECNNRYLEGKEAQERIKMWQEKYRAASDLEEDGIVNFNAVAAESEVLKAELSRIACELEDIRCCADGDYLSRIERLAQSIREGK